jgi:hypothetical protein
MCPAYVTASPIRGLTSPARRAQFLSRGVNWALVLSAVLVGGSALGQSSSIPRKFDAPADASRIPPEDVLRPLTSARRGATVHNADPDGQPARSKVAIRAQGEPESLTWQLDDPPPAPARTKMTPVQVAESASKPRVAGGSKTPARNASYAYPVRQAGGQEELQLQPAAEVFDEPTPVDMQPIESMPAGDPLQSYGPRPRSFVSTYQPKKMDAAPDFKCPDKADLIKPICELTVEIEPSKGDLPQECPLFADGYLPRCWCDSLYMWKASSLCHKPLYFEQVGLERYGHTWHPFLQPAVSGAHFFGSIPILPYKMGVEDPGECIYALGYFRPGDCAPRLCYQLPLSLRGAVYQAAAVTGVVYLLP